jgi:hypothetical protein
MIGSPRALRAVAGAVERRVRRALATERER